ncbi:MULTISPECIES: hypothetical protein [unclassified Frankia]|uniref:hypothetical protein n=1 Tax=unclassified Frankia TaxID=2632575 RepID=UPI002AD4C3EE|nr:MULTISPECIES: hypothetical protein [unclassified Frankia]
MLVNVGVHRGLFSESFFTKDPAGAMSCHDSVTDLLLRHGRVTFDSCTSKNDFTKIIESPLVLTYWEKILNKSTVTEKIPGKDVPWWKITSTSDLASRNDDLAVLLVELDAAQHIFSMKDTLSLERYGVSVTRCDITGVPSPLGDLVRIGNCRYEYQELDQNTVKRDYIEPFLEESSRTVIMDKFVSNVLDHTGLRWFWRLLKNSRSNHGQRKLEIITMIPGSNKQEDTARIRRLQKSHKALAHNYLGGGSNLESITIHCLTGEQWGDNGKHDRHIRFDDRVIEISSGCEVLYAPQNTDANFTYWVKGARHSAYTKITSEERRASKAALYSRCAVIRNGKLEMKIISNRPEWKAKGGLTGIDSIN